MSRPDITLSNELIPFARTRRAVIDIGSNSVRLVIYGGSLRTPLTIFNEKNLCGLGRRDPQTGNLRQDAMDAALTTLTRFAKVLKTSGKMPVITFATAATRDAPNGSDFIKQIKKLGFKPRLLSGDEEAHMAASGVLSGTPEVVFPEDETRPNICGDMGGGSLELSRFGLSPKDPFAERISLPLGPLSIISACGPKVADGVSYVTQQLDSAPWLSEVETDGLFAVGGAWRAMARIHMGREDYPLSVLHHYTINYEDTIDLCDHIQCQSYDELLQLKGIDPLRAETIPHAAMVLKLVLQRIKAKRFVVSSCGVREGILYHEQPAHVQEIHPFLDLARTYSNRMSPDTEFGHSCVQVTEGLFSGESHYEKKLRHAACLMVDVASLGHPDMRADQACDIALRCPFTGIDHLGRLALAAALYQRHRGRPAKLPGRVEENLMGEGLADLAMRLGLTLRFLSDLSPKASKGLNKCSFVKRKDKLIFSMPNGNKELFGAVAAKRLGTLADYLGVPCDVQFKP